MPANIIRFILIVILALVAGTMFGILVGFNPARLSALAYIEQQQNAIRSLNTLLPVMGAACILLTATLAIMSKGDSRGRYLLVAAAILMVVAALVTRFCNQPINAVVMTLAVFLSPTAYVLLLMIIDKFQLPAPPEGFVVWLFCLIPVAALLACGTVVWRSKMSFGRRVGGLVLTVLAMLLQCGVWFIIIVSAITAAIAFP